MNILLSWNISNPVIYGIVGCCLDCCAFDALSFMAGLILSPLDAAAATFATIGDTPNSGISAVCTGVIPPKLPNPFPPLLPPQNAVLACLGDVGKSFRVFGVMSEGETVVDVDVDELALFDAEVEAVGTSVDKGETGESGAGGGSIGEARPSRMAFLSAATSCRRAWFSDLVVPSSLRIASMRRSRSAMSHSSVEMYSRVKRKRVNNR